MAQTRAPTEPRTLEAALSDHAQRTLGACHSSRRFRPVGNGMPITKPSGAIKATVSTTLRPHGSQTSEESSEDTTMASRDRKSTRLNSSHLGISYAVFCLKKK